MDENIPHGTYDRKITSDEFSKAGLQINNQKGPGLGSWTLFTDSENSNNFLAKKSLIYFQTSVLESPVVN